MKCNVCSQSNPDDHKYCGFCGHSLQQGHSLAGSHQEAFQEALIKGLKDKLSKIEEQAAHRIKDDTIKWAKGLMHLYGVALVILLLALGLFGIKQTSDLDQSFKNLIQSLDNVKKTVSIETAELLKTFENHINDADQNLSDLRNSLDKLSSSKNEVQRHLDELQVSVNKLQYDKAKKALEKKLEEIAELSNRLQKGLSEIRQVKDEQTKFDHSLFEINIQADGWADRESVMQDLNPLPDQGFNIEADNILLINVDKSEVIYFSWLARKQSELIVEKLKTKFPKITRKFYKRKERNAREIVIKLLKQ